MGIGSIKILNGRIFDGERFFTGDILVEGKTIKEIGEKTDTEARFTYDAKGNLVAPGLVDIHTHMKGVSSDSFGISPDAVCFPNGVTSAVDCSAYKGTRETLNSFSVKNRVFVVPKIVDDRAKFDECLEKMQVFGDKIAGIKVYFDTANKELKTIKPLCEIIDFAEKQGLKIMVHCAGSPVKMAETLSVLRRGDILTHAFHGVANTALEDNFESMKSAQKRGVIIDSGFAGCVHTNFEIFRKAIEAELLPNTISTDITSCSAFLRGGLYGMGACLTIAEKSGMTQEQILKCVTVNAAAAVGMESGRLSAGGIADIAVFDKKGGACDMTDKDGNRFFAENTYRCLLTVSDGDVVYRACE